MRQEKEIIDLGEEAGAITIYVNGKCIKVGANGAVDVARMSVGDASEDFIYGQTRVGQLTKEGIYIGRFKTEHAGERDYFAAPADAQDGNGQRLSLHFNEAFEYAKNAKDLGHSDWVLPVGWDMIPDTLNTIFNNKSKLAFKATFDETCEVPSGWYWSSSPYGNLSGVNQTRVQRFSDGKQTAVDEDKYGLSLRLVRSLPV